MDKQPSYDYIQGPNVTPTTFYNIGDPEVQDTLARIWVHIGTSEPILLDVLINALTQISTGLSTLILYHFLLSHTLPDGATLSPTAPHSGRRSSLVAACCCSIVARGCWLLAAVRSLVAEVRGEEVLLFDLLAEEKRSVLFARRRPTRCYEIQKNYGDLSCVFVTKQGRDSLYITLSKVFVKIIAGLCTTRTCLKAQV
ncbi:hypothetical protein RIF29_10996 [Crotalaria pallida]|uniref:Uncharacterized protein n=1 Tax=Crotalaria pallida TaxID=3830 RepID=A0AAN9IK53_CROPI